MSERKRKRAVERAAHIPDPVQFIEGTLVDPETGEYFVLTEAEKCFLRHAFILNSDLRLKYPELVFSGPKKSGKTALAAMVMIYVVRILGGPFAEGIAVANDLEQAQGRVYQALTRIIEASPLLAEDAPVTLAKVTFQSTGGVIYALSNDYASAAGSNANIVVADELWAFTTERSHRLWDELSPPPTRKIACRLTVTYAGFEGESKLLESLYQRGLKGEEVETDLRVSSGMLMFWTHNRTAPWQTDSWIEQMRETMRPNAFLRLIENRWVSSDSTFVDMDWWDACVDEDVTPVMFDSSMPVWVGVDASVKRDATAIAVCTFDTAAKKPRIVWHKIFQPTKSDPLDFEGTIENTLRDLMTRYRVREVRFDPYQMQAVAQRLTRDRVPMVEFAQSVPNITEASTNLYELIKSNNLIAYKDAAIRLAISRAVAIESTRGWKISKEKTAHKIDVVIALGMAALGATQSQSKAQPLIVRSEHLELFAAVAPIAVQALAISRISANGQCFNACAPHRDDTRIKQRSSLQCPPNNL
jgi:Phage Terminase